MKRYLKSHDGAAPTIKKTRFVEIMRGIHMGAAYSFDEEAYFLFYPLATGEGLRLQPANFLSHAGHEFQFFRIQLVESTTKSRLRRVGLRLI